MKNTGYSLLEVKSIDPTKRTFKGVATTPDIDAVGDILNPLGMKFANPTTLLWQHDRSQPIGSVTFSKPTRQGVEFVAEIANIESAGVLKDRLDLAWQSIESGLVKAVSVGLRDCKTRYRDDGIRLIEECFCYELSAVTFPANSNATIVLAKSLDNEHLQAALGTTKDKLSSGVTETKTSVKGLTRTMNYAEQIETLEAQIAEHNDTLDELLTKSLDAGLSDAEDTEYNDVESTVANLKKSVDRLRTRMGEEVKKSTPVTGVKDRASAAKVRDRIVVKGNNLPKGTAFTNYAMALAKSKGNLMQAAEIAKSFADTTPEVETVLKAAVAAGTTTNPTWAAPLVEYQTMQSEFIELLRPATIVGKLDGFRRVPFNIRMVGQTSGSSVNWVGEGTPKPVSALAFDAKTLGFAKLAGIVVVTDELIKFSDPNVTSIVQGDLIESIAGFVDDAFLNPTYAPVANVKPGSITNGLVPIAASGTSADALKADVKKVFGKFLAAGQSVAGAHWVMSATQALAISMLQNAVGNPEFPGLTMNGGTFFGLPVVVSEAPVTQGRIVLVKTNEILLAEEGIVLDSSAEASIIMDNDPARSGAPAPVSLWQNNLFALRAERFINWGPRRANSVQLITGANYGGIAA